MIVANRIILANFDDYSIKVIEANVRCLITDENRSIVMNYQLNKREIEIPVEMIEHIKKT